MKVRRGFVSNSSSSSFVIKLDDITARQLQKIQNHAETLPEGDVEAQWVASKEDAWYICVGDVVIGSTPMDNFDMRRYLISIGVDMSKVEWGH